MYAQLVYPAGWTGTDTLADVIDVMTGETNKANLSGSLSQAASEITSTVAGGWTVHDNISTSEQVVKAAHADDAASFKYIRLKLSGNKIGFECYETWNNTNQTGTNKVGLYTSTFLTQETTTTGEVQIHISASARHLACQCTSNSGIPYNIMLATEYTREDDWNTVANAYPSWGMFDIQPITFGSLGEFKPIRFRKQNNGADVIGWLSFIQLPLGSHNDSVPLYNHLGGTTASATRVWGANLQLAHPMHQWGISNTDPSYTYQGGSVTDLVDMYMTTYLNGDAFDTLTYNAKTYVIWKTGSYRWAVAKT